MFLQTTMDLSSTTTWLTIGSTIFLGIILFRHLFHRRKNLPPGPKGYPFIGYLPFMAKLPYEELHELSKIYGDVMSFETFGTRVVHLGSYEAIRDAFVVQGNEFAGRVRYPYVKSPSLRVGIIPSEGEVATIHRRFALHTLRNFGFGRHSLEERIQNIAKDILQNLDESNGQPLDLHEQFVIASANIIASVLFDKSFKLDDPYYKKVQTTLSEFIETSTPISVFLLGPLIRFLPQKLFSQVNSFMEIGKYFIEIITEMVNEHQETFDPNFLRDYVDVYLAQRKKLLSSGKLAEAATFTVDRMKAIAANLFVAGTETTSNSMYWMMRIMMLKHDIQKKLQDEIDEVIGKERFPSIMDRQNMPYAEATINEVLRFSSLVPLGIFRCNPEEVKFRGYVIPKRSVIIANLWAVHHDKKYWPEPDKFDPTRFLGPDGKLRKKESFYPFSAGKRVCMGETLARMELFLYTTSILQRFTVEPAQNDEDRNLNVIQRFVRAIEPYKFCARPRFEK